jgi:hypothetical protein
LWNKLKLNLKKYIYFNNDKIKQYLKEKNQTSDVEYENIMNAEHLRFDDYISL